MAETIAAAANKGGTGKTSTICSLADAAKLDGRTVLCVDLDGQADLSIWLRADFQQAGSYDLLTGQCSADESIQHTEAGIDLICGSADLSTLTAHRGSAHRLAKALADVQTQYDFIFIDVPTGTGNLLQNALTAADDVLIPMQPDNFSLQAMYQIIDAVQMTGRTDLQIMGSIITQYDSRTKANRFMLDTITQQSQEAGIPMLQIVRAGTAVRESGIMQQPLMEYAPHSKPAQDYMALYARIKTIIQERQGE